MLELSAHETPAIKVEKVRQLIKKINMAKALCVENRHFVNWRYGMPVKMPPTEVGQYIR